MKTGNIQEQALIKNDWAIEETQGLKLIYSPALRRIPQLTHAFTTRHGGKSEPPLDSFNLGRHWNTDASRQDASANRSLLCKALNLNVNRLIVPGQVHSTRIAWAAEPESFPDVDAIATVAADTPILLHYADCVPIILVDARLLAVCVVHAGWRGTAGGIASKAVLLLNAVLGTKPEDVVAAVGPAIGPCCYPTGSDVAEQLSSSVTSAQGLIEWKEGKPHPDLKAINAMQLLETGVNQVDVSSLCTACHPQLFYSHRRFQGKTGRQGAIAAIH